MISYRCKQCGAQLELGSAGGFQCPYCGARAFLSDAEFKGNHEFRKKLLAYYKRRKMTIAAILYGKNWAQPLILWQMARV